MGHRESILIWRFEVVRHQDGSIALREHVDGPHAVAQIPLSPIDGSKRMLLLWRSNAPLSHDLCKTAVGFIAERLRNQLGRNLPVLHWVALLEAAVDARTPPDDAWNSDARTLAEWRHGEGWVYRIYPNRAVPSERDARSIRCYWLQPQIDQCGRIERVNTRIVGMPPAPPGSPHALLGYFPEAAAALKALSAPWSYS